MEKGKADFYNHEKLVADNSILYRSFSPHLGPPLSRRSIEIITCESILGSPLITEDKFEDISDTDNTGEEATAWYGPIRILSGSSR